MEFAITGPMQLISSDDSWLPRGARSFLLFPLLKEPTSELALSDFAIEVTR
jgi:hypothetical protein